MNIKERTGKIYLVECCIVWGKQYPNGIKPKIKFTIEYNNEKLPSIDFLI